MLLGGIGVPGLANFPGEFLSVLGAFAVSPLAATLAVLAAIAAGALGVNLYQRLFQGEAKGAKTRDLSPLEVAVLAPIVAATLWLGIAPAANLTTFEADVVAAATATPPPVLSDLGDGGAR